MEHRASNSSDGGAYLTLRQMVSATVTTQSALFPIPDTAGDVSV
jgi:hypothetical protein